MHQRFMVANEHHGFWLTIILNSPMTLEKLIQPLQNKIKEREVETFKVVEDTAHSSKHQPVVNDKVVDEPLKADMVLQVDTSFGFALQNVTDEIVHGKISNNNFIL
jgi:hypothetical protein